MLLDRAPSAAVAEIEDAGRSVVDDQARRRRRDSVALRGSHLRRQKSLGRRRHVEQRSGVWSRVTNPHTPRPQDSKHLRATAIRLVVNGEASFSGARTSGGRNSVDNPSGPCGVAVRVQNRGINQSVWPRCRSVRARTGGDRNLYPGFGSLGVMVPQSRTKMRMTESVRSSSGSSVKATRMTASALKPRSAVMARWISISRRPPMRSSLSPARLSVYSKRSMEVTVSSCCF